ncbi:MAG: hypothetical protein JNK64_17760 [Myxococcales bacterium]|nr:hypothetical protein [Myxococcales bacterium]
MTRLAVVAALAVLAVPALAHAQSGAAAEPPRSTGDTYSEAGALALSAGATAAGIGLYAVGIDRVNSPMMTAGAVVTFVGPSAGHLYTGEVFTRGLGVRTAGAAVAAVGFAVALEECPLFSDEPCDEVNVGTALLAVGALAYLTGTVDDIITAPRRAARLNARARRSVAIAPSVAPDRAGVAVVGTF